MVDSYKRDGNGTNLKNIAVLYKFEVLPSSYIRSPYLLLYK